MSSPNLASYIFLLLCVVAVSKFITDSYFVSPLSKLPGPWMTRFSRLRMLYVRWSPRVSENKYIRELHQRYGPLVRIGPNEISVSSIDAVRKVLDFPKDDIYVPHFIFYGALNMFTMMDRRQHAERKKMISKSYTKSSIMSSGALRETLNILVSQQLLPLIEESSTTRIPMEVCDLNRAYAMDIFISYQYGSSLKTTFVQDIKQRQWYFTRYFRSKPYFFAMTEMPGFLTLLSRLSAAFSAKSIKKALNELENWNLEMCDKAVELIVAEESSGIGIAKREYPVILGQLYVSLQRSHSEITYLSSPQKQSAYPFRYELASEMFDHNLGAHETIGNAISCIQFELSRHPKVQEKLRTELQKLAQPVPVQSSCKGGSENFLLSLHAVDSCPLLNAVILETFRVWPVARTRPRLSPAVCSLEGYRNIPRHVKIQVYPYTLHRNVDLFPEPDAWIPERWTCSGPEKVDRMRKWLLPFGGGERMCIGNHFAIITTKYLIAAIYTKYTSTVVCQRDMNLTDGFIAGPQGGKLILQFQHA